MQKPKKLEPTGPTPTVTLRMPQGLREFVEAHAEKEERSFSWMVVKIVRDWAKARGYEED